MTAMNPRRTPSDSSGRGGASGSHARLASFRKASKTDDGSEMARQARSSAPQTAPKPQPITRRASRPAPSYTRTSANRPQGRQRQLGQQERRPQYLNGGPRRRGSGRAGYNHRGLAPFTWNPIILVPMVLVLVLGFGLFSVISSCNQKAAEERAREEAAAEAARIETQRVHPENLGVTVAGISTPRSAWRQGEMPHLYQTDPAWAYKPYGGGTVRANACGPTALSMVYVYLTGKTDLDPGSMAAFADTYNYAPTGATEWTFMTEGAGMLGLQSWTISVNRDSIQQALNAGQPVICSVGPGDFTNAGHYIVLKSIDSRGMVEVFDPNSAANGARRWPVQRIVNQTVNCWAFTV